MFMTGVLCTVCDAQVYFHIYLTTHIVLKMFGTQDMDRQGSFTCLRSILDVKSYNSATKLDFLVMQWNQNIAR